MTDKLTIAAEIVCEKARRMKPNKMWRANRQAWAHKSAFLIRTLIDNSTPEQLSALLAEVKERP